MQIECVSHGGGGYRGELVWRKELGRRHDFMHEHEQEECLPSLGCGVLATSLDDPTQRWLKPRILVLKLFLI